MTSGQDASSLPDSCPPADAERRSGQFYRLTRKGLKVGDASTEGDWLLPYQKRMGQCVGKADLCECHAHSVFVDLDEIVAAAKISKWVRGKSVAAIRIGPDDGLLAHRPSSLGESHHDWWPSRRIDPAECVIVREQQDG